MSRTKGITVVTVTDNHYIKLLAALTKSIEANLNPLYFIDLWVIDDGIAQKNRERLEKSVDPQITKIHWKASAEVIPGSIQLPTDNSSWPDNIYFRFFIPFFIPQEVRKVLFLDVDMINCHDISELWETNLDGNIAAAVQDPRVKTFDNHWGGVLNYKELGMPGDTLYFNSGLLLMDLDLWRSARITEKSIEYIAANKKFAFYPDQYGLNIALANRWKPLDSGWNHFVSPQFSPAYHLHYIGRKPIYRSFDGDKKYLELFLAYLRRTEWKNSRPISEPERYLKKINNKLEKLTKKFSAAAGRRG